MERKDGFKGDNEDTACGNWLEMGDVSKIKVGRMFQEQIGEEG